MVEEWDAGRHRQASDVWEGDNGPSRTAVMGRQPDHRLYQRRNGSIADVIPLPMDRFAMRNRASLMPARTHGMASWIIRPDIGSD